MDMSARASLFCAVPGGEPLNVWIEPWGISISSADADWLAGWIAVSEAPRR
jgi:hypothetical protein